MTFKSLKTIPGADVYLSKIDLTNGTATNFEQLNKDEWAVNFNAPVVVGNHESDAIIFQGRSVSKKAKDSDLILMKVMK